MFLAIREVRHTPQRFVLIAVVIFLVSYLAYFLTALAYGLASSYTEASKDWHAHSLILSHDSNKNLLSSHLTEATAKDITQAAGGSKNTATLYVSPTVVSLPSGDPKQTNAYLFGIDSSGSLAPHLSQGHLPKEPYDLVIDKKIAEGGVAIGDELKLANIPHQWKVVGITTGTRFQTSPVLYMSLESYVKNHEQQRPIAIGALVLSKDGTAELKESGILSVKEDVELVSYQDFVDNLPGYRAQILTFSLMIGSLIGILTLVLGIFIYVLTMQKRQLFGIMKAQGISTGYIMRAGVTQTLILTIIGVLCGLGAALLTGFLLSDKVPFAVHPLLFILVSTAFIVFTMLGGLAPIRAISKIDPIEAINS